MIEILEQLKQGEARLRVMADHALVRTEALRIVGEAIEELEKAVDNS